MSQPKGFISTTLLVLIVLGIIVVGVGAYNVMKWEKNVTTVNPQGFQNIAANGIVCADGSSPSLGIALELAPFFQDLANKTHMTHVSASLNYWACQVKSGVSTSTVKAYLDSCLTTPKQTYCPTQ